jgi:hypothetical protein
MMVPDTKWDLKDPGMLYTLAITKDGSIRSIRDLRGKHVPMLQQLKAGALDLLRRQYGVTPSALRVSSGGISVFISHSPLPGPSVAYSHLLHGVLCRSLSFHRQVIHTANVSFTAPLSPLHPRCTCTTCPPSGGRTSTSPL